MTGLFFGAQERTRTFTYLRTLVPETSASTNSATWAIKIKYVIRTKSAQDKNRTCTTK